MLMLAGKVDLLLSFYLPNYPWGFWGWQKYAALFLFLHNKSAAITHFSLEERAAVG